jgi:hypothetical protein
MRFKDIKTCFDYNVLHTEKCYNCRYGRTCFITIFIFDILNSKEPKKLLFEDFINHNVLPNYYKYVLEQLPEKYKDIYEKLLLLK